MCMREKGEEALSASPSCHASLSPLTATLIESEGEQLLLVPFWRQSPPSVVNKIRDSFLGKARPLQRREGKKSALPFASGFALSYIERRREENAED